MGKDYFGSEFEEFGFTPHVNARMSDGSYRPVMLSTTKEPYFGHVTVHLKPMEEQATIRFGSLMYFGSACLLEDMSLKGRSSEDLKAMLDYAAKCSHLLTRFGLTTTPQ